MGFKGGAEEFPPAGLKDINIGGWSPGLNFEEMITPFEQLTEPLNLSATQTEVDEDRTKVTFAWEAPANIGEKRSVTYNLALKNTDTSKWLYNPMAFIDGEKNGLRQVVKMGNAYLNKSWSLTIPKGNYEWTVQAIDGGLFGGKFAAVKPLNTMTGLNDNVLFRPTVLGAKGKMVVSYNNDEVLNARIYSLTGVKLLETNFVNELSTPLNTGAYLLEVTGKSGTYKTKVLVK